MLGDRIKKLRGKRSQEEVSEKIGISRARLSHYETGRSEPDTETLQKIADVFGVTIDFLLGRDTSTTYIDSETAETIRNLMESKQLDYIQLRELLGMTKMEYQEFKWGHVYLSDEQLNKLENFLGVSRDDLLPKKVKVAGKEINLTSEELKSLDEIKEKFPVIFHDLVTNPEKTFKEFLQYYKMKKMLLEDEDEETGDGFGELED